MKNSILNLTDTYHILKRIIPLNVKIKTKALLYDFFLYRKALNYYKLKHRQSKKVATPIKTRRNILLLMPHLEYGGVETLTYGILKKIPLKKYNVHLVCTQKKGELYNKFLDISGLNLYDLSHISRNPWVQKDYIEDFISKKRIDTVIISNNEPYYFIIPYLALLNLTPRIFSWLHCDSFYFNVHERGYNKISFLIDKTIVVNNQMKAFLSKSKKIPPNKIIEIKNGIDAKKLDPKKYSRKKIRRLLGLLPQTPVVGFVGRLTSEKKPLDFIKVAKAVNKSIAETIFIVVGDGYYKLPMMQLAKKLGIKEKIIFTGNTQEVPKILRAIDVFISTSISEGFGLAVAEAMAMEIPVVAYDVGGISELIVNNATGHLVTPEDYSSVADTTITLLKNNALRKKLGINSRKKIIQDYSINQTAEKLLALIDGDIR